MSGNLNINPAAAGKIGKDLNIYKLADPVAMPEETINFSSARRLNSVPIDNLKPVTLNKIELLPELAAHVTNFTPLAQKTEEKLLAFCDTEDKLADDGEQNKANNAAINEMGIYPANSVAIVQGIDEFYGMA